MQKKMRDTQIDHTALRSKEIAIKTYADNQTINDQRKNNKH